MSEKPWDKKQCADCLTNESALIAAQEREAKLKAEIERLSDLVMGYSEDADQYKADNAKLQAEIEAYKHSVNQLTKQYASAAKSADENKDENAKLRGVVERLREMVEVLEPGNSDQAERQRAILAESADALGGGK